jgi:hypothetical protein
VETIDEIASSFLGEPNEERIEHLVLEKQNDEARLLSITTYFEIPEIFDIETSRFECRIYKKYNVVKHKCWQASHFAHNQCV